MLKSWKKIKDNKMPTGIYKRKPFSEEHKKNIGIAGKGKKRSMETRKKISDAKKGKKFTIEHKKKLSQSRKGKKLSSEHSSNISKALKGRVITWADKISKSNKGKLIGRDPWNKGTKGLMNPRKGSEHGMWKGGISKTSDYFKRGQEYREWARLCLERDNFTCKRCCGKSGKYNIHHIKNYSDFPELRTDINNGITLCRECHVKFHHLYGRKNNTKEQLDEFIESFELTLNK